MALWLIFAPMTLFVVSAVKNRDLEWSMGYWSYVVLRKSNSSR